MGAMRPRDFERYQQRVAEDMARLRTFVDLTASPPAPDDGPALPPDERLRILIEVRRDGLARRIDDCPDLDEELRERWRRAFADVAVTTPAAAAALDGLADRVDGYADTFPYGLGFSRYAAATTLHETLRELARNLRELAVWCRERDRDDAGA